MGRHGENIRKRKDGRWEARVPNGKDANGKTRYRYVYGHSYPEVKAKKQELLASGKKLPAGKEMTFAQLAESFLEHKQGLIKESSILVYEGIVRRYLLPRLGPILLRDLTPEEVAGFLLEQQRTLSPKTIADIRILLCQILRFGVNLGQPAPPKIPVAATVRQPEIQVMTQSEQCQLGSFLLDDLSPFNIGVLLTMYTGLRIGEICALRWEDINEREGTLRVNKTLMRIQNRGPGEPRTRIVIEEPKTPKSRRLIPLPDALLALIDSGRCPDDCYVLTGTPHPMEPRNCLGRYKRILQKTGLPDYTFHALRHSFATRCVEMGFDVKSLSEIMGHSSVSITMQRYVHPTMEQKRNQMNRLEIRRK